MVLLSKRIDKQIAAYQRELIETHYAEVDNMYRTGDVVDGSIAGFHWYDENGNQTVETGLQIEIGEIVDDRYTITISQK